MSDIDEKLGDIDASIARIAAAITKLIVALEDHWENEKRLRKGFPE